MEEHVVPTEFGSVPLFRWPDSDAWVLARHGVPHRYLPHQIPFRAHTIALKAVGCSALLLTSSVGVLDAETPLFTPVLLGDLLMPENRLPGGGPCTMWPEPSPSQGHLVWEDGPFSSALNDQIAPWLDHCEQRLTFAYQSGPRTKTASENRWFQTLGAHVNSMSIGPEVVLANELEIPVAGLVTGHKRSGQTLRQDDGDWVARSLRDSRVATESVIVRFLNEARGVDFANRIHRFSS
ncbi:MAG: 5'-methylthioadenosine phosphorylase [Myxococcota bacterium]